jgi:hypothetical protein
LALRWIKRMFHPSPSDQKSGLVSSKKFHASFTTTSIPIPQGLEREPNTCHSTLDSRLATF